MKKIYNTVIRRCVKQIKTAFWIFITTNLFFVATDVNAQIALNNTCNFLNKIGGITSTNGAEIPTFDPGSKRVFVVAGPVIEYYTLSNTGALTVGGPLPLGFPLPAGTIAIPNSVAVSNGILAASYAVVTISTNAQQQGRVTFYNASTGAVLNSVQVGYLPDMITFTPDGSKLLTANEGEPNSYNQPASFDPEGSVSIIDISTGIAGATVQTASFTGFNSQIATLRATGVRIYGPNATVAQDVEPEYIAFSADGTKAWVTLQENNAFAIIDISSATVMSIIPLGLKNHNLSGSGLDASDRDLTSSTGKINIQNWPVFGMYQPDAIAQYTVGGQSYFITANEGDSRSYIGYSEESRVGDAGYVLDPAIFPNAATLKQNANLGRLLITNATGNVDGDSDFDQIHALGARSFSIWNSSGNIIYDSGDQLEQITATNSPALFNSDGTAATFDTRSDNKGPEPEAVVIGVINNVSYAFIGLERVGDIMVYNVSDPAAPFFVQYINMPEDIGVEGLIFITAANSPTGKPLLISAAEVSRTVAVFEINIPTIQVTENSGLVNNDGIICQGSPVTLTASGSGPYLWNTGATTATITVTPETTTTFTVTACFIQVAKTITVNPVSTCSITAIPENSIYTGGVPVNIYLGYGPQKLMFNVAVPASGAPYTYLWSGGVLSNNNIANPVFTALVAGSYTFKVLVTNQYGCTTTCEITISVIDVRVPGTKDKKVYVCHNGHTLAVSVNAVSAHLGNHVDDRLGRCNELPVTSISQQKANSGADNIINGLTVKVYPNPAKEYFTLQVQSNKNEVVQIRVMDIHGKLLYSKWSTTFNNFSLGHDFIRGTYIVEVIQGDTRKTLKLVKH